MFRACIGIAHDTHSSSLFVADSTNGVIRKILIPTANVTAVTSFRVDNVCSYLCVARGGHVLDVTVQFTSGNAGYYIMSVNTTVGSGGTGQQRQLAGGNQVGGNMVDGAGVDARFYSPQGIALNSDETLLFVVDSLNNRIRTLSLLSSSNVVGTIAGNESSGMSDGADATFNSPCGAKRFCNASLSQYTCRLWQQRTEICCHYEAHHDDRRTHCFGRGQQIEKRPILRKCLANIVAAVDDFCKL